MLAPAAFVATLLALAPALSAASCLHGMLEKRQIYSGTTPVPTPSFGYTGVRGPLKWHTLSPANELCKTGTNQSPININPTGQGITVLRDPAQRPQLQYPRVASAKVVNRGTEIQVPAEGNLLFGGAKWALRQYHFHTPSEHRLNEEYYVIEVHFVHQRVDPPPPTDKPVLLVFGVFFELSRSLIDYSSEPFSKVFACSRLIPKLGDTCTTQALDYTYLAAHAKNNVVYQYAGSLTTPPCSEGVTWLVSGAPLKVTVADFLPLKDVLNFNSRPTQNDPGSPNLLNH